MLSKSLLKVFLLRLQLRCIRIYIQRQTNNMPFHRRNQTSQPCKMSIEQLNALTSWTLRRNYGHLKECCSQLSIHQRYRLFNSRFHWSITYNSINRTRREGQREWTRVECSSQETRFREAEPFMRWAIEDGKKKWSEWEKIRMCVSRNDSERNILDPIQEIKFWIVKFLIKSKSSSLLLDQHFRAAPMFSGHKSRSD